MSVHLKYAALILPAFLVGCGPNSAQFLQEMEPEAIASAEHRGAFEMNCPSAKGTLLSDQTMRPALQTFVVSGPYRAVYNVGVAGCGKRTTYQVICPNNGSKACFDGGSRTEIQED